MEMEAKRKEEKSTRLTTLILIIIPSSSTTTKQSRRLRLDLLTLRPTVTIASSRITSTVHLLVLVVVVQIGQVSFLLLGLVLDLDFPDGKERLDGFGVVLGETGEGVVGSAVDTGFEGDGEVEGFGGGHVSTDTGERTRRREERDVCEWEESQMKRGSTEESKGERKDSPREGKGGNV